MIGLGGDPERPNNLFCLPLSVAKYPEMYYSVIKKYERITNIPFTWENGHLK